jgi:hypothetical protein
MPVHPTARKWWRGAVEDRAAVIPPSIVETDEEPPAGLVHPVRRMTFPELVRPMPVRVARNTEGSADGVSTAIGYVTRTKFDTCAVTSEPSGVMSNENAPIGITVESVPVVVSGS